MPAENCFVGVPGPNGTMTLRNETDFLWAFLDASTGNFAPAPVVTKASMGPPYDEVLDLSSPQRVVPIVRIPMTAATYLYHQGELVDGGSGGVGGGEDSAVSA